MYCIEFTNTAFLSFNLSDKTSAWKNITLSIFVVTLSSSFMTVCDK